MKKNYFPLITIMLLFQGASSTCTPHTENFLRKYKEAELNCKKETSDLIGETDFETKIKQIENCYTKLSIMLDEEKFNIYRTLRAKKQFIEIIKRELNGEIDTLEAHDLIRKL